VASSRSGHVLAGGNLRAAPATVEDFFRGKTITMLIGYTSGGGYDLYARVLSKHMGRHIPGNPSIVPQNMPGAGSLRVANVLYNTASKDGLTIGMIGRGMAMEPLIGASQPQYDARKFTWLGSGSDQVSLCATWHTSPVKRWSDMLATPFTVGGEGSGSDPDMFAMMIRNLFGVKVRLVSGYRAATRSIAMGAAKSTAAAAGRGQASDHQARLGGGARRSTSRCRWRSRRAELADVPLIMDYVRNERERQILRLMPRQQMGWPFLAPPGLPASARKRSRLSGPP
jgi:tripartite-type tricarboxylate transporter receptor subunit TctC